MAIWPWSACAGRESFAAHGAGVEAKSMRGLEKRQAPQPFQLWLSRPPFLLLAQILEIDERYDPPVVSYRLHDDDGSLLDGVRHTNLDDGWWRSFQPLVRRYG
jgi:hypothetical protein